VGFPPRLLDLTLLDFFLWGYIKIPSVNYRQLILQKILLPVITEAAAFIRQKSRNFEHT